MSDEPRALTEAWEVQAEWSARASLLKARIGRQRTVVLWLVMGTALFGGVATTLSSAEASSSVLGRVVSGGGALLAGLAGVMQVLGARENVVEQWSRARSVSEALKEAVYRYRCGIGIYAGPDPDTALRARVQQVVERGRDLLAVTVPPAIPRRRPPPSLDASAYVERRVTQQIDGYYRRQVAELTAKRTRWQRAEQGLLFGGAVLGALAAVRPGGLVSPWVAVATTVAGAIAAHAEASRFSHLIVAYRATADRLAAIRSQFLDDQARGVVIDVAALVDRAEDAISVENQAWMAGWSGGL